MEGGRRDSTKFYTGRLRQDVRPLTLLYTIFDKKKYSFRIHLYLLLTIGTLSLLSAVDALSFEYEY